MTYSVRWGWLAVVVVLVGCGRIHYDAVLGQDGGAGLDSSADVDSAMGDAAIDARSDAGADLGTMDADIDASMDADVDASTDADVDASMDAGVDAEVDLGPPPASFTTSPLSGLMTGEAGGFATFTVVLDRAPSSPVTFSVASTDASEGDVDASTLSFDSGNWNVAQTVTVTGVDDALADGAQSYEVVVHVQAGSDPDFVGLADAHVSLLNTDDETPAIVVSPTSGLVTTEAGGTATFSVVLSVQPTADVSIAFSTTDATEGTASPGMLTFTSADWSTPQTVTVTGVDDFVDDGDVAYTIVSAASTSASAPYSGVDPSNVDVTNTDDDVAGVTVTPTVGLVTAASGRTATFTIELDSEPTADVTVGVSSTNTAQGTVSPASVTFTSGNWSTPQAITITGIDDAIDDGQFMIAYGITTTAASSSDVLYNGMPVADVSASNINMIGRDYLKASNTDSNDSFGWDVALSSDGSTLAVSTIFEASNATGINGNEADNSASTAGAVYVFARSGASWAQQAYIKASNTDAQDTFGRSIAISANGDTLVVGAPQEASNATGINGNDADNSLPTGCCGNAPGAAYVFVRSGATWTQQAYVKASNSNGSDNFGTSVAISGDGNTVAVGAYREASNATGINGNQADNSVFAAGAVYAFTRSGVMWSQQAYIKSSNTDSNDVFGISTALSADGNTLAVGAYGESSAATGINGNQADNSKFTSGAAYVFVRTVGVWSQQAYVKSSNPDMFDMFATSLALSGDGNTLAVSSQSEDSSATGVNGDQSDNSLGGSGAAYVFTRVLGVWSQQAYIKSGVAISLGLGSDISLSTDGNTLAVGAQQDSSASREINVGETDMSAPQSGTVLVFTRSGSTWTQLAHLKAPNADSSDLLGGSVSLAGNGHTLLVSALNEDSSAVGVNGNRSDNSAPNSGAAYVFYW